MPRQYNTNRAGEAWTEAQKLAVWQKGDIIPGLASQTWRRDRCGHSMQYSEHGNRNSNSGWEIDHINPVSNGGTDDISNLQPLYWENNAAKSDNLNWKCGQ